jgi:outer membrane immunogenic protein
MGIRITTLLAVVLGFGASQAASAADLPVKARPPVVVGTTWTGFYIGANVGGSWSNESIGYSNPFTTPGNSFAVCGTPAGVALPVPTLPNPFDLSNRCGDTASFAGGGQIGYNWQNGPVVYGLEADVMWRKLKDRQFVLFGSNPTDGAPMGSVATDITYLRSEQGTVGTLRGRLGYAQASWLVYVTGGLAVGQVKHSVTEVLAPGTTCLVISGTTCRSISDSTTKAGFAIGAGGEWWLGKGWSVGAEYLYVDLGRTTLTLTPLAVAAGAANFFTNTSTSTFDDRSHIGRIKLNYHWNGMLFAMR